MRPWYRVWVFCSSIYAIVLAATAFRRGWHYPLWPSQPNPYLRLNDIAGTRFETIRDFLVVWGAGSLFALLVGHGVAWIIRGFKESRPNKAPEPTTTSVMPRANEGKSK